MNLGKVIYTLNLSLNHTDQMPQERNLQSRCRRLGFPSSSIVQTSTAYSVILCDIQFYLLTNISRPYLKRGKGGGGWRFPGEF